MTEEEVECVERTVVASDSAVWVDVDDFGFDCDGLERARVTVTSLTPVVAVAFERPRLVL